VRAAGYVDRVAARARPAIEEVGRRAEHLGELDEPTEAD